jgi:hypothetical protein
MVSFLTSEEYQQRFSSVVTPNNVECRTDVVCSQQARTNSHDDTCCTGWRALANSTNLR